MKLRILEKENKREKKNSTARDTFHPALNLDFDV